MTVVKPKMTANALAPFPPEDFEVPNDLLEVLRRGRMELMKVHAALSG